MRTSALFGVVAGGLMGLSGVEAGTGLVVTPDINLSFDALSGLLIPRATPSTNLQTFTGAIGGKAADPITNSGDSSRPFEVGGSTFPDFKSAFQRSCDNQKNDCADFANGAGKSQGIEVSDCDAQQSKCSAAEGTVTQTSFPVLTSSDANFDYFCDP